MAPFIKALRVVYKFAHIVAHVIIAHSFICANGNCANVLYPFVPDLKIGWKLFMIDSWKNY